MSELLAHAAGCAHCGALNRIPPATGPHAAAASWRCWRCDSALEAEAPHDSGRLQAQVNLATALAWASCIVLVAVHLWPMLSLELQGQRSSLSLAGAAGVLWSQGHWALATALFLTTVAAPVAELALMLAVVHAMRQSLDADSGFRCRPWHLALVHAWQSAKSWNMTEIFILGTAVALVKLGEMATLLIGAASLALLAFMILRLLTVRSLSVAQAWTVLGRRCMAPAVAGVGGAAGPRQAGGPA